MLADLQTELENARQKCPEGRETFDDIYMKDFRIAMQVVSPALAKSRIPGDSEQQDAIAHEKIVLAIGAEAMMIIEDTSYRFWGESTDSKQLKPWARAVWRYALLCSVGHIIGEHNIKTNNSHQYWSPVVQDLPNFYGKNAVFTVQLSRRPLDGNAISSATFMRVFGLGVEGACNQLITAQVESFGSFPCIDNPIYNATKRAIRKAILSRRGVNLPFWWTSFINQMFSRERDFIPLTPLFINYGARGGNIKQNTDNQGPIEQENNIIEAPVPSFKNEKDGKEIIHTVKEPDIDYTNSIQEPNLAAMALNIMQKRFNTSEYLFNEKGAVAHITGGRLCVVTPIIWNDIARAIDISGVDGDTLIQLFLDKKYIPTGEIETWGIYPKSTGSKKRVGIINLYALDAKIADIILGGSSLPENNCDLQYEEKMSVAKNSVLKLSQS